MAVSWVRTQGGGRDVGHSLYICRINGGRWTSAASVPTYIMLDRFGSGRVGVRIKSKNPNVEFELNPAISVSDHTAVDGCDSSSGWGRDAERKRAIASLVAIAEEHHRRSKTRKTGIAATSRGVKLRNDRYEKPCKTTHSEAD
ncbi:hypothetical protein BHE74_00013798 [Ensete ventricosum]|nr:hypothetical protein BHE74_00013798 [Ensete ventricosum]